MKIVIAGAGGIGFHLAKLLSSQKHDITLIDINQDVLDYAQSQLDVICIKGDASSVHILQQSEVQKSSLLLAVTTSEKTNLITAILAKKMGSKKTIARVSNIEYLREDQKATFQELGVDTLICPQQLAAREIVRLIKESTVTDLYEFDGGRISLIGFSIHDPMINEKIPNIEANPHSFRLIAVLRGGETIIPDSMTSLRRNDHAYFIVEKNSVSHLLQIFGKEPTSVRNIMIIGGSEVGVHTAQLLEHEYHVTIVEEDKLQCKHLVEVLDNSLIVKGNPSNIELLRTEGLSRMDAFIALTPNTESNILTSLMADKHGVQKTIALVENMEYIHISQNIGVDTLINKKLIAANFIFRYVRKGVVEDITSLHGTEGEVIEFVVHKDNRITKKKLVDLHIPSTAVPGAVIRDGSCFFPDDQTVLKKGDKVIVFALPEAIPKVEQLFR